MYLSVTAGMSGHTGTLLSFVSLYIEYPSFGGIYDAL